MPTFATILLRDNRFYGARGDVDRAAPLYRFKDTLSSDNVMILSPNKVFGDYIADVLPELGEEQIAEIDFDKIASDFLAKVTDYETFSEQVVKLLDHVDEAAAERIRYKATPEFVTRLDAWITSRRSPGAASASTTPRRRTAAIARRAHEWADPTRIDARHRPAHAPPPEPPCAQLVCPSRPPDIVRWYLEPDVAQATRSRLCAGR